MTPIKCKSVLRETILFILAASMTAARIRTRISDFGFVSPRHPPPVTRSHLAPNPKSIRQTRNRLHLSPPFRRLRVRLRRRLVVSGRIRAKRYKLPGAERPAQLAAGNRVNCSGLRRNAALQADAGWFRITAPFSSALPDPITYWIHW